MVSTQTLSQVRARDLMSRQVVTLPTDAAVSEALQLFEDEQITGVPIVDAAGTPVGMLSARDVARADHMDRGRLKDEDGDDVFAARSEEEDEDRSAYLKEDYSHQVLGRTTVLDWMRPGVLVVEPDATLKQVCEVFRREGVHRLLVTSKGRIEGIVTTMDVVRLLAESL